MQEDHLLQQAISAAHAGHELTARDIFLQIVQSQPQNEVAWMWLTGLLDDIDDRIYACEKVLEINPGNAGAQKYLAQLLAEKQKGKDVDKLRVDEQLGQVRELVSAGQHESALRILRSLTQGNNINEDAWSLLAELVSDTDEKVHALEKLVALNPGDIQASQELKRLHHFQQNPLEVAEMYEEQGNFDKAIEVYKLAALKPNSKKGWDSIYWKIIRLENLRQENIAHISPSISVARLTGGPALLYLLLMLLQVGINPFVHPEPFLWVGFFWVLLGGFMVALASVRSHHRLWFILFKDIGAGGSPSARSTMNAVGWILVVLPYLLLIMAAINRLKDAGIQSMLPR
jgi:tetratricopeptide (TPR) repeat protein